ncbi:MAG: hypothetical protein AAFU67_10670, partial [Bacteroidota bacterium]
NPNEKTTTYEHGEVYNLGVLDRGTGCIDRLAIVVYGAFMAILVVDIWSYYGRPVFRRKGCKEARRGY